MREVHVIVPDGIDDPGRPKRRQHLRPSGLPGLAALGWTVHEHAVNGGWPRAGAAEHAALARAIRRIPDGAVVLLDGLVACAAPAVLVGQATRLRQVVLVHMPLGDRRERDVLASATAVVTTSAWTRRRLAELHGLPLDKVHVAEPGVDAAAVGPGSDAGAALLCVAAVTPGKGHDVMLDAFATTTDLSWRLACVGSLDRDPAFAESVQRAARQGRSATACGSWDHARGRSSTARTPARTCSCSRRTPRPTAWSSRRPWRAGCRCSSPTSAGWPRPWGTGTTAPGRAARPARRSGGARRRAA